MNNLYSKVPPIPEITGTELIVDAIETAMKNSNELKIAVGYVSVAGLDKLDKLIFENKIKKIQLVVGMYKSSGIPKSIYNKIIELHEKWTKLGIGKIYFVNNMNYHGKVYVFLRNGIPFEFIVGSSNLSVLSPEGQTLRQYEVAVKIKDSTSCNEILKHIESVIKTSTNTADDLQDFEIINERIAALNDIENVIDITPAELEIYTKKQEKIQFRIPIKAPKFSERFSKKSNAYAHSNINVCYGKGRKNSKSGKIERRNWYETQITVSKKITSDPDYPKGDPFYLITDDGYKFLAHSTAQNNKQLTAYGNLGNDRVFGRWIKGRLATAGYIKPYDNVDDDKNGDGIVTSEMLVKANMQVMVLTKTATKEYGKVYKRLSPSAKNKKGALDKNHFDYKLVDVWTIHFENLRNDK